MRTSQELQPQINELVKSSKDFAFMTREQLFDTISQLVFLSNELINFSRELDTQISKAESEAFDMAASNKMNASLTTLAVKRAVAPYKADKEWAGKQTTLLNDIRIAALAAQRSAE